MPEILLDTDFASIVYHPEKKVLHHTFFAPASGADFRLVIDTSAEFIRSHAVEMWLADDRYLNGFSEEDLQWILDQEWFPFYGDSGLKCWALVVPDVMAARADFLPVVRAFNNSDVRIMIFSTLDEALEWFDIVD